MGRGSNLLALLLLGCAADRAPREPQVQRGPTPEQRFFDWSQVQFAPSVHAARRTELTRLLRQSGGGVFVATSAGGRSHGGTFRQRDDFLYFTGLELPDSILTIDVDAERTTLFVPRSDARFESDSRANDFPGRPLAADPEIARRAGIELQPFESWEPALAEWLRANRQLQIPGAIEPAHDLFAHGDSSTRLVDQLRREHPHARLRNAQAEVARLRMVKSAEEIALIRRACAITARGIRAAARHVADGTDERTLEAELEAAFKRRGAQRLAFDSIIKSGPNSLWPWRILAAHYDRRNRVMRAGELVIFDVGCELDHYASDVGRTFPVSGRFSEVQRRRLEMSTAVCDAVIAAVRPGVTFAELKRVAVDHTPPEERRYMQTGVFFGHHIGLDVGDANLAEAQLEAGMVFTVEPWYYNHDEQLAVFIEDVVLVTETGAENLTRALPRTATALERMVRGAR